MNNKTAIIIATIVLVAMVTLLYFFPKQNGDTPGPNTILPTPSIFISKNATNPTEVKLETIMQTQLPIQSPVVDIAYSRLIKKFYIYKKTPKADAAISDFFVRNGLENITRENRIVYTNRPALHVMLDDEKRLFPNHPDTQELDY